MVSLIFIHLHGVHIYTTEGRGAHWVRLRLDNPVPRRAKGGSRSSGQWFVSEQG
jgi:hypothetical protein